MDCPLAVFATDIGAPSETFIRRHVLDLLPGQTATMAYRVWTAELRTWSVDGPILSLRPGEQSSIKEFLQQHKVKVILGEYLDEALTCLDVAKDLGIRFFGHAHGYDVSQRLCDPKWRAAYQRYKEADGIITMSRASRTRIVDLGLPPMKIHVVPYGVDVPVRLPDRPERAIVRCVAVGRMVAKKAPLVTLDAFRRAAETCENLQLDFVGDGDLFAKAQEFIDQNRLTNKVRLHGSLRNEIVQQLLSNSDIFLQHSMTDPKTGDGEGLPVALLEAMAHGLPIVSTWHAGIPEAVIDGCTGYLVNEGDAQAMAERLQTFARASTLRRRMGRNGWIRAQRYFRWEQERGALLHILGLEG